MLAEYDFHVKYKPGVENGPADYLSRNTLDEDPITIVCIEEDLQNVAKYFDKIELPPQAEVRKHRAIRPKYPLFAMHENNLL